MDKKSIVLGSGDLYITEFTDGAELPSDEEVEKEDNRLGYIKGGATIEYTPTFTEAKDDLGKVKKTILTEEEAILKSGLITWCGETLEKICSTARVTTSANKRIVKIGGTSNQTNKKYFIHFVHKDSEDGDIRISIVGNNQAGFSFAFVADEATQVDVEFKAHPMDDEGNQIVRKGNFLGSYMSRRILHYTHNFSGTYEDGMRYLQQNVEAIPLLELGEKCGDATQVCFQTTWKNCGTMLTKLAKSSGLGYRVRPDFRKKKLYFEVYKGTDHTVLQLENPHVIFSKPYENLNDVTYTYDDKKYGTVFYVGGEGEGEQRKIVRLALGEENGTELREVFIDAKDVRQEELSDSEYEEVLLERGREKAADYVKIESIEAEVEDANFIYKKDWDIGDLVTVRKKEWGITLNERVTEVQEVYEDGGMSITPTFGDALPETLDLSED